MIEMKIIIVNWFGVLKWVKGIMLNDHSEPYIESNDNPKGIDLITLFLLFFW